MQGRAVTPEDYKSIIPKVYPNTKSVQVWGGEDNSTSVFGRVYISLVPTSGSITASAKETIISDLKNTYTIASVTPVIVDPITTFIDSMLCSSITQNKPQRLRKLWLVM